MDFKPTEEQRAWEERAERLAREALAPRAAAMDARGGFPNENFQGPDRGMILWAPGPL